MVLIYTATDMPKINLMILLKFHFLGILECTVFCAVVHSFMCKRERSCIFPVFLIGGVTVLGRMICPINRGFIDIRSHSGMKRISMNHTDH